ncbi:hypothetical protein JTB14_027967 [Gonioctena quinquepunctata]|nr:hypothetical protein JTB14_027967 [Gonioctena quinquepunctata]
MNKACINQNVQILVQDRAVNSECAVINHSPICSCSPGHTGDPFARCYPIPPIQFEQEPTPQRDPCVPSPCGLNSQCRDTGGSPSCSCLPNYFGQPPNCRPECTINSECSSALACIRQKCIDPCPGSCGFGARCSVINHTPICTCPEGYTGDPFTTCSLKPQETEPVIADPCNPSPCGSNAQCNEGVCTCLPEYQGDPHRGCRPECVLNNDCPRNKACLRNKCKDPCPGVCGQSAECTVINHIPTCSCIAGYIGNAFVLCNPIPAEIPKNPCNPSPCGPNSQCREINGQAVCSCVPGYIRTCGINALCQVVNHNPICSCQPRHSGDPFVRCSPIREEPVVESSNPCQPSPCGSNAQCKEINGSPSCSCLPEYIGSPPNCRPECISNSECSNHLACINQKCKDPCPGTCGQNAECRVVSHTPNCVCSAGYTGDPFSFCHIQAEKLPVERPTPCLPSPCGSNAECRERNGAGSCICLPDYIGNPYEGCRPECTLNSDCHPNKACIRNKCVDPCPGTCGQNANCHIINHLPTCSCLPGHTGDPFRYCNLLPQETEEPPVENPCQRSPCGPNSQCREVSGQAVCSCLPEYTGTPPGCRPECTVSSECTHNKACMNLKCIDPCPGTCGLNANCQVINHSPICSCQSGYTGDPFTRCYNIPLPPPVQEQPIANPCVPSPCGPNSQCRDIGGSPSCSCSPDFMGSPPNCRPEWDPFTYCQPKTSGETTYNNGSLQPSPCGSNAQCENGICTCIVEYQGDPYIGCRPECLLNNDCPKNRACIKNKCTDPCPGTCGQNAECSVINHIPTCSCIQGYEGNAFVLCKEITVEIPKNPCSPTPCGPNSQCREINGQAVCSCVPGFIGSPPACRPECISSSECPLNRACVNQKCIDPCPGTCGLNANCQVVNHNPICSCAPGHSGDPFTRCSPIREEPVVEPANPCQPSPCGPNSQCRDVGGAPSCSCLQEFIGTPPNCRPECVSNTECSANLACIIKNAKTLAWGNPFILCHPQIEIHPIERPTPCVPSPCGINANCREQNGAGSCTCLSNYIGNPYEGCRPECSLNSDCPSNKACIANKCKDPCPGTCGLNAECQVVNHLPSCNCITGYSGDPFRYCSLLPPTKPLEEPSNPCQPNPCGPNSQCREVNDQAVCSCLPEYTGSPPGCRPECVVSSECSQNKACVSQKCIDPCEGTCGLNAACQVINHSPICSCKSQYTGDPFTRCYIIPPLPQESPEPIRNPCQPTPCGPNSQCLDIGGSPSCSCLATYIGSPPNCRPECTINSQCSSNWLVFGKNVQILVLDPAVLVHNEIEPIEKDICNPSPCGPNALCDNGICTCIPEYRGDPYSECRPECVLNSDCRKDLACINNKCKDPCPGTCGQNAQCTVFNHIPSCTCIENYRGNAFVSCSPIPAEIPKNPCNPSPCGPNSQYPCPGTCGFNAKCQVVNHNPICSCPIKYSGDPFTRCVPIEEEPVVEPSNPCQPSPCGPNSQCRDINGSPSCSCLPEFIGSPPNCKPECISNSECSNHLACINQKCKDPCPGICGNPYEGCRPECVLNSDCNSNKACVNNKCKDPCPGTCGQNAECRVINHLPSCNCVPGYTGDPFRFCNILQETEPVPTRPCQPNPCGPNSQCREINEQAVCSCLPNYIGSPPGCRPECTVSSECSLQKACVNQKCTDPCPGTCGLNTKCNVINHSPICSCQQEHTGDPFTRCYPIPPPSPEPSIPVIRNPCVPSPCGPHSICQDINGAPSCSCITNYIGSPPNCRPECIINSECSSNLACIREKCRDPCPGSCGIAAICSVINHIPICTCLEGYNGDPFDRCIPKPLPTQEEEKDLCKPSPCGSNAICNEGVCSCIPETRGNPYEGCRPECLLNADCPRDKACIGKKCLDPCPGTCGHNAECFVINHIPSCSCIQGHIGNAFVSCSPIPAPTPQNPCSPSPCGPNSQCREINGQAVCSCVQGYIGSPPTCRPECVTSTECSLDRSCVNQKCIDPCPGTCGLNARCQVVNHNPICSCLTRYSGDPFTRCQPIIEESPVEPYNTCQPSPCGPNAECRDINGSPSCSCLPEFFGSPPNCKPECISNNECANQLACMNNKCKDPCPGICGINAECRVVSHTPNCLCLSGYSGDPFQQCMIPASPKPLDQINPCHPSPCGANAICKERNNAGSCICLPEYIGNPYEGCRPECVLNSDCSSNTACINNKCRDPCPGTCGQNANCQVINHLPSCSCITGFTGDPFRYCSIIPMKKNQKFLQNHANRHLAVQTVNVAK